MKVPLNVRIDPAIRAELIRVAKEENRTLSNLVETALIRVISEKPEPKNRLG